jgi:NADP-dependent 3-hydroxy acid dehydrogenase YdfG
MVQPREVADTIRHIIELPGNSDVTEIEIRPTQKPN